MRAALLLLSACGAAYEVAEVVEAVEVGTVAAGCVDGAALVAVPRGAVVSTYRCDGSACESVPHRLDRDEVTIPGCLEGQTFRVRYVAPAQ